MNVKVASTLWVKKAREDLVWAGASIREKVFYGACFAAQQAAEKALKAYLLSRGKKVIRIHDLGALIEACSEFDSSFQTLRDSVLPLTDYYIQTRYPDVGELIEYSEEKTKDALGKAQKVVDFVESKIEQK